MSGQPCKGYFCFFIGDGAVRRPFRLHASIACGYFYAWISARVRPRHRSAPPSCRGVKSMTYRYFLSFSRKCFLSLATLGATTNWQYDWRGLRAKYSWW